LVLSVLASSTIMTWSTILWAITSSYVRHNVSAALYAGHVKFSMYVAPMIYLLLGVGIAALLGLDLRRGHPARFVQPPAGQRGLGWRRFWGWPR